MPKHISRESLKTDVLPAILGIYIVLVGVGVPLVVRDRYFDILAVKYGYYWICTGVLLVALIVYALTLGNQNVKSYLKECTFKKILNEFTASDCAVLVYLIVAILSTASSDYFYESFWGNEGRYTGLYLISWYVVSYFSVSRFCKFKTKYIDLILVAGMLVCLFGITDYFRMDIFHFKIAMIPEQWDIFTSTIGNINTYTAYVGIIVAISTVLFTMVDQGKKRIFYCVCMVISFFAIIMGVSDNAYLSLGALFGFLPLVLFKKRGGIFRYFVVLATLFSVIQCIDWINGYLGDGVLGIDSAFDLIIEFGGLYYLVAILWAVVIIWYFIKRNKIIREKNYGNIFANIWLVIIFIFSISLLYLFYDCNIAGNVDKYGRISNYLLFNDDWGTNRGYIWRNAMEQFQSFTFWKKIVGFGPETFGILLLQKTRDNPYDQLFDNAHNEYLQLLITVGIAGLISYVIFILTSIKRCFVYKTRDPYIISIAFAIICYSVQALVNLNLPIVTPVFWLILGMGASMSLKSKE